MSGPPPPRRLRIAPRVQNFDYPDDPVGVKPIHEQNSTIPVPSAPVQPNPVSTSPLRKSIDVAEVSAGMGSGNGNNVTNAGDSQHAIKAAQLRARREKDVDLPVFKNAVELLTEEPDMVISHHVNVKGGLKFDNLLRIDGIVTGSIVAPASAGLIIGEHGTLVGNVLGLGCMLVEGKVIGNINVESLCLLETATVHGDVAARSVDIKSSATIVGNLHISAFDPLAVVDPATGRIDPTRRKGKFLMSDADAEAVHKDAKARRKKARKAARKAAKESGQEMHDETKSEDDDSDDELTKPQVRRKRTTLYIIDPQNDFHSSGSCAISGADQDAERIAEFIYANMVSIDEIFVTLDSHHRMHIAHAIFWQDKNGKNPPLYTAITLQDVLDGLWVPRDPSLMSHCKFYLGELERRAKGGITALIIKPEHCLIGSKGHAVVRVINQALQDWATTRMRKVAYIFKGTNILSDTTSSLCADVVIREDPSTDFDPDLMLRLSSSEHLVICGQSLSHGVNFTMRDLLTQWTGERARISLLRDCCSVDTHLVAACGNDARSRGWFDSQKFWAEMKGAGVTVVRSNEAMLSASSK